MLAYRQRRSETCRTQKSVGDRDQKQVFTVSPVDFDRDQMHSAPTYCVGGQGNCDEVTPVIDGRAPQITDSANEDNENESLVRSADGVVPISSCVAAVGVAMASVATSHDARRRSTTVRLTRLRQKIGSGLYSADSVRVPIWLSLLLVVVYIAVGAVMFSAWESVGVTSQSLLC